MIFKKGHQTAYFNKIQRRKHMQYEEINLEEILSLKGKLGQKIKNLYNKYKDSPQEMSDEEFQMLYSLIYLSGKKVNKYQMANPQKKIYYTTISSGGKDFKNLDIAIHGVLYRISRQIDAQFLLRFDNWKIVSKMTDIEKALGISRHLYKAFSKINQKYNLIKKETFKNQGYLIVNPFFFSKSKSFVGYKCFYTYYDFFKKNLEPIMFHGWRIQAGISREGILTDKS